MVRKRNLFSRFALAWLVIWIIVITLYSYAGKNNENSDQEVVLAIDSSDLSERSSNYYNLNTTNENNENTGMQKHNSDVSVKNKGNSKIVPKTIKKLTQSGGKINHGLVDSKPPVESKHTQLANVPRWSVIDIVPRIDADIVREQLWLPRAEYTKNILILTPVRDVAWRLPFYATEIRKLTYPRNLISIHFGEDGSLDDTFEVATKLAEEFRREDGFWNSTTVKFNTISGGLHGTWKAIHSISYQGERRGHIAKARNLLLEYGMEDDTNASWVLWIDSDISFLPSDLIQQFIYADKDVMASSCLFYDKKNITRIYDKNSWRETPESLKAQTKLKEDDLVFEGYKETKRIYLPHLKGEGRIVPIDGVGGCSLMVRASCHRQGLRFPETSFRHHIETEGLAKMAQSMGYSVYGLPFVDVFH